MVRRVESISLLYSTQIHFLKFYIGTSKKITEQSSLFIGAWKLNYKKWYTCIQQMHNIIGVNLRIMTLTSIPLFCFISSYLTQLVMIVHMNICTYICTVCEPDTSARIVCVSSLCSSFTVISNTATRIQLITFDDDDPNKLWKRTLTFVYMHKRKTRQTGNNHFTGQTSHCLGSELYR